MIDYGMPTLIETATIADCARLCGALGLSFIEINMNLPQYQPEQLNLSLLRALSAQYGIYFTIHLDENLNISDFNPRVARAYTETVTETIAVAKALHIPVLNMHLSRGVYFTLPDRRVYLFAENETQYLQSIRTFRELATELIGDSGIKLCVENSDGYTDFQIKALDLLLESPVFMLTFDIGHNHCTDGNDETIIMNRSNRLQHMHIHDAVKQTKKNHLPLGDGELDLQYYLNLAEAQHCRAVIETKTIAGLKQSVEWLKAQPE